MKKAARRVMNRLFDPFWDFYYKHHRHAPKRFHQDDLWMMDHWGENPYDPICFPLPLRINCLACRGCSLNRHPLFAPPPLVGPFKLAVTDTFAEQYKVMFGGEALFDFLWEHEKRNQTIDSSHIWACKGKGCHETCDSHPCLIERAMREESGAYAE